MCLATQDVHLDGAGHSSGLLLPTLSLMSSAAMPSPLPSPQHIPQNHFPPTTG